MLFWQLFGRLAISGILLKSPLIPRTFEILLTR